MGKFSMLAALGVLTFLAVTRAMPQPGSDSSSEESAETGRFKQEISALRTMCRKNTGSEMAFVFLAVAMQKALSCAGTTFDEESFMSDIDTLSDETRTEFFSTYCAQLKGVGTCLDDLVKAARPCFEEDDFTIIKALTGTFPDAVDLVCKNEGEMFFKYEEPEYEECFAKLSNNVTECAVPFAAEGEYWDISHLTQTQCGTISGLRQCIEGKLNGCNIPEIMSVYDLFHNKLFRMTPCHNYVSNVEKTKVTEVDNNAINEV